MTRWSLSTLLGNLHDDIQRRLDVVRQSFGHPTTKGDAGEGVWLELLATYLPKRYEVATGHVVDSNGDFSEQIDIIVFDRQYSPFIFRFQDVNIIPAESVYAIFECKQALSGENITYSLKKALSVRRLFRTSLPIPHAGGEYKPKAHSPIIAGLLCFDSDWTPPLGTSFLGHIKPVGSVGRLDMGCVAAHGHFYFDSLQDEPIVVKEGKPATAFLLQLISSLQKSGTVPMIDVMAYAKWLTQ
jgi:hypothetical protein